MGYFNARRQRRSGLVALLFLALPLVCRAQSPKSFKPAAGKAFERNAPGELKGWEEIRKSGCKKFYREPLSLLFFLPGPIFFLVTRRARRRKSRVLLMLLSCGLLLGASGGGSRDLIRKAEEEYLGKDFNSALDLFRETESEIGCNSALEYNKALCYHYLGKPGQAVYHLRKSISLNPGDREVRIVLKNLEENYGLAAQVPVGLPVNPDLPYFFIIALVNCSFVLGAFLYRKGLVRLFILLILLILLIVFTAGSCGFFLSLIISEGRQTGIVASNDAALKKIPESSGRSWFRLKSGTALFILGETEDFFLVETGPGIRGWIEKDLLLTLSIDDSSPAQVVRR